jgi:hypothetical protein
LTHINKAPNGGEIDIVTGLEVLEGLAQEVAIAEKLDIGVTTGIEQALPLS